MQRKVLDDIKPTHEALALFSRGAEERCTQCGNKGHDKEKCWPVIGYPSWHPRSKKFPQKKANKQGTRPQRFNRAKAGNDRKTTAYVESTEHKVGGALTLSQRQIE